MSEKPTYEDLERRVRRLEDRLRKEDLQESRERYKSLFDNNHSSMLLIDPATADIVDANAAALAFYGWSHEEIVQKKITQINALSEKEVFLEMTMAREEKRNYFHFIHRLAGGELRDVEVYSGPITISGKKLLYSVIHDITERKALEQELEAYRSDLEALVRKRTAALESSTARLETIFTSTSNGIAIYEAVDRGDDFIVTDINPSVERIERVSAGDVVGKPVTDVFPGVEKYGLLDVFRRVWKSGEPEHFPARVYEDNRIMGWRENYIFRLPTREVVAIYSDITEQKQTEEKLRRARDFLQTIIDGVHDSLMVINRDFTIALANRSALEMAGMESLPEKTTCHWLSHHSDHPCEGTDHICTLMEVIKTGEPRRVEHVHRGGDGEKQYVELVASPIFGQEGEVVQVIELARDISGNKKAEEENKRLQERLQQNQKMEAIGTLAGGIAHDFNNILASIMGFAQLAQNRIMDPVKAASYIEKVLVGAQRATDLVRQILTFSRQTEYQKRPQGLSRDVEETLKLLRASIPSTVEIRSQIESRFLVLADSIRIHQTVMNLCTNAYHAMQVSGGRLTVILRDETVSKARLMGRQPIPAGSYVRLEIRDTGHGMDSETLKRAFDPYYTTKTAGQGTGLGLSLVRAIVEEHGAFMDVSSTPGLGTRFTILFPAEKGEESKQTGVESLIDPGFSGGETIMVADDEDDIRDICKDLLESHGYRVHCYKNGRRALEAFLSDPGAFDLLITDVTMPGLSGDRLCKEVLALRPGLPVIMCTGFSDRISQSEAMAMGVQRYVQKPLGNKALLKMIRELLG